LTNHDSYKPHTVLSPVI